MQEKYCWLFPEPGNNYSMSPLPVCQDFGICMLIAGEIQGCLFLMINLQNLKFCENIIIFPLFYTLKLTGNNYLNLFAVPLLGKKWKAKIYGQNTVTLLLFLSKNEQTWPLFDKSTILKKKDKFSFLLVPGCIAHNFLLPTATLHASPP